MPLVIDSDQPLWEIVRGESPLMGVALHHGHEMRSEVLTMTNLDEATRLREEDPYTGELIDFAPTRCVVRRSRFEMDLNRPREGAVYREPEDAWGLEVWNAPVSQSLIDASIQQYDHFYATLFDVLASLERAFGSFVVYEVHSYNYRRGGPQAAADAPAPLVNLGTGQMNRRMWKGVVEAFTRSLGRQSFQGEPIGVGENVCFKGGHFSRWVREQFPRSGCVLSIEVRKSFMDEWTGEVDSEALGELRNALAATVDPVLEALDVRRKKNQLRTYRPSAGRPIRIGFVVNNVATEEAGYTTVRMAMTARQMGHEAYLMGVGDLAYDADERIRAHAVTVPKRIYKNGSSFLRDLRGPQAIRERITVDDLDVLLLRNDPAQDALSRPWAAQAGILFGREAMRHGVVVLNDPNGLAKASSKMYFQTFPPEIRPETIITRNRDDIRAFCRDRGTVVLKPLTGSGGQSVFLVRPEDLPNLNQMIDSIFREGFVIAQEYLPAASRGDMRLFVMNGEALKHRGKYAAFRRVRKGGDLRSNIHAGGMLERAVIGPQELDLVEIVRPQLMQDGMFLVGLDIVGDKLMEINVFSPGGFGSAQKFEGVNFSEAVIKSLERKTRAMGCYRRQFDNIGMALV